jgi:site-specific DNA recombinase
MQEKAEHGLWPTVAPLGYRNISGPDGKKIIEADPEVAPLITQLFEWYATGQLSLKDVAKKARDAGLVHRKSGAPVPVSTVHAILRHRIYTGDFEWGGRFYKGRHEPLVSVDLWEQVQGMLAGRFSKKHRRMTYCGTPPVPNFDRAV